MFIELHMIQNFVPSNLNRDDTNNPKDCEFGGVRRARISSQCIKRSIRTSPVFAETTGVDVGTRTKWLVDLLRQPVQIQQEPRLRRLPLKGRRSGGRGGLRLSFPAALSVLGRRLRHPG